jgi:hypothetical protein
MLFALFFGLPSVNISDFGKKRKTRQGKFPLATSFLRKKMEIMANVRIENVFSFKSQKG